MAITSSILTVALFKATEQIWNKGFDAFWEPIDKGLKGRFLHWAGKDQERVRRDAFARAATDARRQTIRQAMDRRQAEAVLRALDDKLDPQTAAKLADEAAKLMLFSAEPDIQRMTEIVGRTMRFEALFSREVLPQQEVVTRVLVAYMANLRDALLDEDAYSELTNKEMLRVLREIVVELRPVKYDDEDRYRLQMATMYRDIAFVGIPQPKEQQTLTIEDIFVRLRAEREVDPQADHEPLEAYHHGGQNVDKQQNVQVSDVRDSMPQVDTHDVPATIEDIIQEITWSAILGEPGAGKTTLLRFLAVICAEGRAEEELGLKTTDGGAPLPIFVSLRTFAVETAGRGQDYSLLDYLYTHASEHLMLNLRSGFFEEALDAGRCLVCLDGLDEVGAVGQRKMVRDAVTALAARYPHNRYLVTSRIVGYDELSLHRTDFTHYKILPLTDEDIRLFVQKWYTFREQDPVRRQQRINDLIGSYAS